MIDVEGGQHLDCCNNVACVGHGHSTVVEAGRRELVRKFLIILCRWLAKNKELIKFISSKGNIQTNGRFLNPIQQRYLDKLLATFPPELNTVELTSRHCLYLCIYCSEIYDTLAHSGLHGQLWK